MVERPKYCYNGQFAAKLLSYFNMEKVQRPVVRRTLQANGNGNGTLRIWRKHGLFSYESMRCY